MRLREAFIKTGILNFVGGSELEQNIPHLKLDLDRYVHLYLYQGGSNSEYITRIYLYLESKTKGRLCEHIVEFPWGSFGSFTRSEYRWSNHIQPTDNNYIDFCKKEINGFINKYWE